MPKYLQRITIWILSVVAISAIAFVPVYILTNGLEVILSQSFAEGIVVEVFGAIGTAALIVNIELMAMNTELESANKNEQVFAQLQEMTNELKQVKQELETLRTDLREDSTLSPDTDT